MTEAEWLTCEDPRAMIWFASSRLSERIVRGFAVLACRSGPTLGAHENLELAVDTIERMLDGVVPTTEVRTAVEAIEWGRWEMCESLNHLATAIHEAFQPEPPWEEAAMHVIDSLGSVYPLIELGGREDEGYSAQCSILRELIPFRPITFSPDWRTDTALALARQMYESRDFSAMPILADALQDAGCDSEDVLSHCREPGPHVRGCWVVDAVLGTE
jgi:hypothetical protein